MLLLGGQAWNKNTFLFVPFNKFGTYSACTVFRIDGSGPSTKIFPFFGLYTTDGLQEFELRCMGPFEKKERSNDGLYLHLIGRSTSGTQESGNAFSKSMIT